MLKSVRAESPAHPGNAVNLRRQAASASRRDPLRIAVVGAAGTGLVTAACLARFGHRVVAVESGDAETRRLARAEAMSRETGLEPLVQEQVDAGRLRFVAEAQTDAEADFDGIDIVFVGFDAPARADGSAEWQAVDAVADRLGAQMKGQSGATTAVVLISTVPVGTAQRLQARFAEAFESSGAGRAAPRVLVNPAFLREGCAVADFTSPERLLIGDDAPDGPARRLLLAAYAPLVEAGVPVSTMDTRSAELSKQAANAMLATRISFINEIAGIAAATGADIDKVREGLGIDRRIGRDFLRAGIGYGGPGLPNDVAGLRETARQHNVRSDLLLATERINSRQRCWAFDALQRDLGSRRQMRSLRVAVWGLAFKPGTADMREAPSLALIDRLTRASVCVTLYDPAAMANARVLLAANRRVAWADSAEAALCDADVLMLVTEWPEFVAFDPERACRALTLRAVYDGRNALDAAAWGAAGLRVAQVGRAAALPPLGVLGVVPIAEGPAAGREQARHTSSFFNGAMAMGGLST